APPPLPSFPTRRSSDLSTRPAGSGGRAWNGPAVFWQPVSRSKRLKQKSLRIFSASFHRQGKGVRHLLPERPEGCLAQKVPDPFRSEEHTSELQSRFDLV